MRRYQRLGFFAQSGTSQCFPDGPDEQKDHGPHPTQQNEDGGSGERGTVDQGRLVVVMEEKTDFEEQKKTSGNVCHDENKIQQRGRRKNRRFAHKSVMMK